MDVDFLIIGQGISGTWLSYYLQKEGRSFLIIDNNDRNSASRLAAGIINPVTGRRHVKVWMAEEILPFAQEAYSQFGMELNITAISQRNIIDFFPSPQMRVSFIQRVEEKAEYVSSHPDPEKFRSLFNYDFGCGEIQPVFTVHLEELLPAWRQSLKSKGLLTEEEFDIGQLKVAAEKIEYKNVTAGKIIFCDGAVSATNSYFDLLPFAPNKGELMIVSIPDLPAENIYKKGMTLVPLSTKGLWWVGSSYAWTFDHPDPTPEFREKTEALLTHWLKMPFTTMEHLAGIRPATLERRPFVGLHPIHPTVGIFNGMGAKGCSLAPYFAKQFTDRLCHGRLIEPKADIARFRKILSRKNGN